MAEQFVQTHIRNLPIFGQLTTPQIGVIAALTAVLRFEPGQLVVQEGQPTQGLFLFAGGRGILTRRSSAGMEDRVGTVESGQYIDETALYDSGYEPMSLRIVETAIVLLIPRAAFVQMVTRYPEIRANLRVQSVTDVSTRQTGGKLFKGQRDDETVLHVWRRHWWAVARYSWIAIVVALALFAFALVLAESAPVLALGAAGLAVIIPGAIAMYLYFEWQNDSIVVSDQRIVRIWNQIIGFENTLSEIPLDRVIEVNVTIPPADPFARLFHYGTIFVRTAGEAANMTLEMIQQPQQVQSAIFTQRDRFRDRLEKRKRETVRDDVEQALGMALTDQPQPQPTPMPKRGDRTATIGLPFIRTKFVAANGDLVYRKHSTVWVQHIMLPALAVGGSLTLMLVSALVPAFPLGGAVGLAAGMFLLIVSLIWFYAADWDWRNDLFIIGSDAITLIRKRPLWLQNEAERIRISQIDNVKSRVDGLINNILDRGNVQISLIGSDLSDAKVMDSIYDPQEVQAEISRRLSAIKNERQINDIEQQRQVIKDYLQTYHELQQSEQPTTSVPPAALPGATYARPAAPDTQVSDAPPPTISDGNRPPRIPKRRPDRE